MQRFLTSAALATAVAGGFALVPSSAHAASTTVTATYVNIRTGPGLNYSIIGGLRLGAAVSVRGARQGDWTPITYQGRNAWIYSQYIKTTSSPNPAPAPKPSPTVQYTTAGVNFRTGPGLGYRIIQMVPAGTAATITGSARGGFAPVSVGGRAGWISTAYLSARNPAAPGPTPAPATPPASNQIRYTTMAVNVRITPDFNNAPIAFLTEGMKVHLTGGMSGPWAQFYYANTVRWIHSDYLQLNPPSWDYNAGGSVGLNALTPSAKGVVNAIRGAYPEFRTIYGVRPDGKGADHTEGRAIDFMTPRGVTDAELGTNSARWLQANASRLGIRYIIWRQEIWLAESPQLGWQKMADRGSPTQNHMDHVHVSTWR